MNELVRSWFFGQEQAMTDTATFSDGLFIMLWWFGVFWFVLLMGLMVYWVIKYRRRPGVPAQVSPSHNTPLEILWTVIPSSSLLVIFLLGFWGYMEKVTPAAESVTLDVRANMWNWVMTYPNGANSTWSKTLSEVQDPVTSNVISGNAYPIFVLPEDTDFNLRMISIDVIHAFWIPDLRVKMDVYPNRYTGFSIKTPVLSADDQVEHPETGEMMRGRDLVVFCAEYCGDSHSQMAATIRVVPKGEFDMWLASMSTDGLEPWQLGENVWKTQCVSCHSIDGSPGSGPTWLGGASDGNQEYGYGYDAKLSNGQIVPRDDNYLRESIILPQAKVVAGWPGNMPKIDLSEEQIAGLLAFYQRQSDRGPAPEAESEAEGEEAAESGDDAGDAEDSGEGDAAPVDEAASEEAAADE